MLAAGVPKFSIKGKTLLPVVPGGMGAGLPLELPGLAEGCPEVALIPILPDARGVGMVRKKWRRLKNSAAPSVSVRELIDYLLSGVKPALA